MLCLQSMLPVLSLESSFSLFHDELRMCNTAAPRMDAFTAIEYLNLASCAVLRIAKLKQGVRRLKLRSESPSPAIPATMLDCLPLKPVWASRG